MVHRPHPQTTQNQQTLMQLSGTTNGGKTLKGLKWRIEMATWWSPMWGGTRWVVWSVQQQAPGSGGQDGQPRAVVVLVLCGPAGRLAGLVDVEEQESQTTAAEYALHHHHCVEHRRQPGSGQLLEGPCRDPPPHTVRPYWFILVYMQHSGLYWIIVVCTGLYWFTHTIVVYTGL